MRVLAMVRLTLTYLLTLLLGIVIAAGLAFLVGLALPGCKLPVFWIITLWWVWTGWKHATAGDRGEL